MDLKKVIEGIIEDLIHDNKSISTIFLKLQVIVHTLNNENLRNWVKYELHGYPDRLNIPEYRIIPGVVYGDLEQDRGFQGSYHISNFQLPISHIKNDDLLEMLRTFRCTHSISKIEELASDTEQEVHVVLPDFLIKYLQNGLKPNCYINQISQHVQKFDLKNIVDQVKYLLLQFLLEINDDLNLEIEFTAMENKEKIEKAISNTIYAGVVATGDNSTINANESNVVGGNNNNVVIQESVKKEIAELVDQICKISDLFLEEKEDVLNELARIRTQLKKSSSNIEIIRSSLKTVYNILMGVAGNIATPVVEKGIKHIMKLIGG